MTKPVDLKKILAETFQVDAEKIDVDTSSDSLTEWDSLAHVKLITKIEEALGVSFDAREVARMTSMKEILKIFKEHGVSPSSEDLKAYFDLLDYI